MSKLLLFFGFLELERLSQYLTVATTDSQTSNARSTTSLSFIYRVSQNLIGNLLELPSLKETSRRAGDSL